MTTTVASAVVTAASSGFDEAIGNDAQLLRDRVLEHLRQQGLRFADNRLLAPVSAAKGEIRALHEEAVAAQQARARKALARDEGLFLHQLARGSAIDVAAVSPALVPVSDYRGFEELLWRWVALHWSIPVSMGTAAGCGFWSWIVFVRTVTN